MKSRIAYEDLIGKYLSGNISSSEKTTLFGWMEADADNRAFFDQMVEVWSISVEYEEEELEVDTAKAWSNVEHHFQVATEKKPIVEEYASAKPLTKSTAKIVQLSPMQRLLRITAILIPLLVASYWIFSGSSNTEMTLATLDNEKLEYQLPDGTQVWLNENSSLTFDTNFTNRTVVLEGEAFFDVTKMAGKKFEILSGEAKTTVFGTSFNVRAYPKESLIEVTVETGIVQLSKTKMPAEKVELRKGDSGIYKKKENIVAKEEEIIVNANAWKTQTFNFKERKIQDVLISLTRYFETDFMVQNKEILNCTFKINNLQNPDIQTIKELIEFETNGNILLEKENNKYIFKGQGCN